MEGENQKISFILGAGFSKAIYPMMPLMNELTDLLSGLLPNEYKHMSNFEDILSILYNALPWKTTSENHRDKSIYFENINNIYYVLKGAEDSFLSQENPDWLDKLLNFFHENKSKIVTFNYDTLIERTYLRKFVYGDKNDHTIDLLNLYQCPIVSIKKRNSFDWGLGEKESAHLIKIHGSLNWLYDMDSPNNNYYYQPIYKNTDFDYDPLLSSEYGMKDLERFMIPPLYNKTEYMNSSFIKTLWNDFRYSIYFSDEIYIIGYSLPESDSYLRNFLNIYTKKNAKIFIVNIDGSDNLLDRYKTTFTQNQICTDYLGSSDCIKDMCDNLDNL